MIEDTQCQSLAFTIRCTHTFGYMHVHTGTLTCTYAIHTYTYTYMYTQINIKIKDKNHRMLGVWFLVYHSTQQDPGVSPAPPNTCSQQASPCAPAVRKSGLHEVWNASFLRTNILCQHLLPSLQCTGLCDGDHHSGFISS